MDLGFIKVRKHHYLHNCTCGIVNPRD